MFVDASAIVAIIAKEPDRAILHSKLSSADMVLTSPLAVYEAITGLARIAREDFDGAYQSVREFLNEAKAEIVAIDEAIGASALEAFLKFGKGRHKAGLNMGDCFSYACAKRHRVPLLFKGDDFIHTDIKPA
jgi:ribonuclease VapC